MSDHYHDPADLRFLKEMNKLAPTEFNAWLGLDKIVGRDDGAIPRKYRELIALAVACTTQCPYCIEAHVKALKAAGATREEITECSLIAAALRGRHVAGRTPRNDHGRPQHHSRFFLGRWPVF